VSGALGWIIASGIGMCIIAAVGSVAFFLSRRALEKTLLPLVALAAGSLIGGAFFHMIPAALAGINDQTLVWLLLLAGFSVFFLLEQLLHWHHCHRAGASCRQPLTYLVLLGDGLHNFLGGLAIGGAFLIDVRLGIAAWIAAAAHELPQELGDFGVLVHGGWSRRGALVFNVLSGSTFLLGGLLAYAVSGTVDVALLIPIAAGNFIYIGATDLVPEVNKHADLRANLVHFSLFIVGVALMFAVRFVLEK
jgi:zinc and cadmium transporter